MVQLKSDNHKKMNLIQMRRRPRSRPKRRNNYTTRQMNFAQFRRRSRRIAKLMALHGNDGVVELPLWRGYKSGAERERLWCCKFFSEALPNAKYYPPTV